MSDPRLGRQISVNTIYNYPSSYGKTPKKGNAQQTVVLRNSTSFVPFAPVSALTANSSFNTVDPPSIPYTPTITTIGENPAKSPNNAIIERTNTPRFASRVPDIYGKIRAVPDLLTETYRIYKNNKAIEISYLAVGKGEYDISDIKEGSALLSAVPGVEYDIYQPFTSPQSDLGEVGESFKCVIQSTFFQNKEVHPANYSEGEGQSTVLLKGPVIFNNVKEVFTNFTFEAGANFYTTTTADIHYQQVDETNTPFGDIHTETVSIPDTSLEKAFTNISNLPFSGKFQVTVERTSDAAYVNYKKLLVESMFGVLDIANRNFGDVTTIRVKTEANETTSSLSSRSLNCLAFRKLDGVATSKFSEIALHICLDKK